MISRRIRTFVRARPHYNLNLHAHTMFVLSVIGKNVSGLTFHLTHVISICIFLWFGIKLFGCSIGCRHGLLCYWIWLAVEVGTECRFPFPGWLLVQELLHQIYFILVIFTVSPISIFLQYFAECLHLVGLMWFRYFILLAAFLAVCCYGCSFHSACNLLNG